MVSRRDFLRILALGVVGHELDIDRLLWVPGKVYSIPSTTGISLSQIVAIEMERIAPKIKTLFERDDIFYAALKSGAPIMSSRAMRVPLVIMPGDDDES